MALVTGLLLLPLAHRHAVAADDDEIEPSTFFPLEIHWITDLPGAPVAPPAIDDDTAFVPLRNGSLAAVAIEDGTILWTASGSTSRSPVAGEGIVVVAESNRLLGLRACDGALLWTRDLEDEITAPLVLSHGWLVVALDGGDLAMLRSADGAQFWRRSMSGRMTSPASIAGSTVYVPVDDGRILALGLTTGEPAWETRLGGRPQTILPLDDLFVGADDNFMYRLHRADGRVVWQWRTGADIVGLPAVSADRVFFASLDNLVRSLDRTSGVQQWRHPLPGRPTAGPRLVDDMVFVSGVAPLVLTFDMETGRPRGRVTAPGELAAPAHVLLPETTLGPGLVLTMGDGRLAMLGGPLGPPAFPLTFPPPPLLAGPDLLQPVDVLPFEPLQSSAVGPSDEVDEDPADAVLADPVAEDALPVSEVEADGPL